MVKVGAAAVGANWANRVLQKASNSTLPQIYWYRKEEKQNAVIIDIKNNLNAKSIFTDKLNTVEDLSVEEITHYAKSIDLKNIATDMTLEQVIDNIHRHNEPVKEIFPTVDELRETILTMHLPKKGATEHT